MLHELPNVFTYVNKHVFITTKLYNIELRHINVRIRSFSRLKNSDAIYRNTTLASNAYVHILLYLLPPHMHAYVCKFKFVEVRKISPYGAGRVKD